MSASHVLISVLEHRHGLTWLTGVVKVLTRHLSPRSSAVQDAVSCEYVVTGTWATVVELIRQDGLGGHFDSGPRCW